MRNGIQWHAIALAGALGVGGAACDHGGDDESAGTCRLTSDCRGGEMCDRGVCVPADTGDDPSGGEASSGGDVPMPGGDGSMPGGDGPTPGGDGPNPGDGGPTPGGDEDPVCTEGEITCQGGTLEGCVDGALEQAACDDVCGSQGYTSDGCSGDKCSCDGFLDETCALGVQAFCVCSEAAGETCDNDTFLAFYQSCWEGEQPELACFASFVDGNQVDCASAVDACL